MAGIFELMGKVVPEEKPDQIMADFSSHRPKTGIRKLAGLFG